MEEKFFDKYIRIRRGHLLNAILAVVAAQVIFFLFAIYLIPVSVDSFFQSTSSKKILAFIALCLFNLLLARLALAVYIPTVQRVIVWSLYGSYSIGFVSIAGLMLSRASLYFNHKAAETTAEIKIFSVSWSEVGLLLVILSFWAIFTLMYIIHEYFKASGFYNED